MSIEVKHLEGDWMERLVVWKRVKVVVGRALDGQTVAVKVPSYHLEVVPF